MADLIHKECACDAPLKKYHPNSLEVDYATCQSVSRINRF